MMFQAKKYTQPWSKSYQVNTIKQEIVIRLKQKLVSTKIDLSVFTEKGLSLLHRYIWQPALLPQFVELGDSSWLPAGVH
jgi:hypothetical protein